MTNWSYTIETHPVDGLASHLQARGADGWELCGVRDLGDERVELYFKRPATDNKGKAHWDENLGAFIGLNMKSGLGGDHD